VIVNWKADFFLQNESIRINSWFESIRIIDHWSFDLGISAVARTTFIPILMLLRLFIVELWANASNCRHGVITLTFDLWRHRVCRLCGPSYSVPVPSSGLIRLFAKIVANFPVFFRPCHSHSFCKAEYHGHKEDNACYSVAVLLAENRNERIFSNIRESCYWKTAMKLLVNCYRMW